MWLTFLGIIIIIILYTTLRTIQQDYNLASIVKVENLPTQVKYNKLNIHVYKDKKTKIYYTVEFDYLRSISPIKAPPNSIILL